jgi:hypothetical protein
MRENFERLQSEGIQMNISITRIETTSNLSDRKESKKNSLTKENKFLDRDRDKNPKQPIEKQKLKPRDIMFEKLPIQKFFPIAFEKCIETFYRIEKNEKQIFIDLKLEKGWQNYLINKIQNTTNYKEVQLSEPTKTRAYLNVDITEIGDKKVYHVYTCTYSFRFVFSDEYLYANMVFGLEYLSNYNGELNAVISQKEIKKGLLNYIFRKWIN